MIRTYAVGLPKTGTKSIARMFADAGYRSVHEPEAEEFIAQVLKYKHTGDSATLDNFLLQKHTAYDLESSSVNYAVVEKLVSMFPDARFILTYRDCRSWLRSLLTHISLDGERVSLNWKVFRTHRFGKYGFEPEAESGLAGQEGVFPLRGYVAYWREHITRVRHSVPGDRLLCLSLGQLSASSNVIQAFVEAKNTIRPVHVGVSEQSAGICKMINEDFLDRIIRDECGALYEEMGIHV